MDSCGSLDVLIARMHRGVRAQRERVQGAHRDRGNPRMAIPFEFLLLYYDRTLRFMVKVTRVCDHVPGAQCVCPAYQMPLLRATGTYPKLNV